MLFCRAVMSSESKPLKVKEKPAKGSGVDVSANPFSTQSGNLDGVEAYSGIVNPIRTNRLLWRDDAAYCPKQ